MLLCGRRGFPLQSWLATLASMSRTRRAARRVHREQRPSAAQLLRACSARQVQPRPPWSKLVVSSSLLAIDENPRLVGALVGRHER